MSFPVSIQLAFRSGYEADGTKTFDFEKYKVGVISMDADEMYPELMNWFVVDIENPLFIVDSIGSEAMLFIRRKPEFLNCFSGRVLFNDPFLSHPRVFFENEADAVYFRQAIVQDDMKAGFATPLFERLMSLTS